MFYLFLKGGPVMWPLLATSVISLSIVIERLIFLWRQRKRTRPEDVAEILSHVRRGALDQATKLALESQDPVAQVLAQGLLRRKKALSEALMQAASQQSALYVKGISALETIVTLAPFLGLLGTVTGMIRAFGLIGAKELEAPVAITGGISEALIATAFGLMIALFTLVPLNLVGSIHRRVRRRLEHAATELEIELAHAGPVPSHEVTA